MFGNKRDKVKNSKRERTSKNYCPECGMHIRGKNHKQGEHHKQGGKGKIRGF